jgi:hypothetical protein
VRVFILGFLAVGIIAAPAASQEPDHNMAGHDHSAHTQASMPGMDMTSSAPDWI